MSNAIVQRLPVAPLEFTVEQTNLIRQSFLSGASEAEAGVLLELARLRRLNPITRQIHFVKRWDSRKGSEVWSAQVGIDGFRAIAERTGLYDGQDEPEFEYDKDNRLTKCRVRIYRKDWTRPAVGLVHFREYCQFKKGGELTQAWADKPHIMMAKCAEALAFRKAFPEDTSGLYAPEEMPEVVVQAETGPSPMAKRITAPPQPTPQSEEEVYDEPTPELPEAWKQFSKPANAEDAIADELTKEYAFLRETIGLANSSGALARLAGRIQALPDGEEKTAIMQAYTAKGNSMRKK